MMSRGAQLTMITVGVVAMCIGITMVFGEGTVLSVQITGLVLTLLGAISLGVGSEWFS